MKAEKNCIWSWQYYIVRFKEYQSKTYFVTSGIVGVYTFNEVDNK